MENDSVHFSKFDTEGQISANCTFCDRTFSSIIFAILFFSFFSCSSLSIHSPTENLIQLEREGVYCEKKQHSIWYYFWGMGVFNGDKLKPEVLFSDSKKSYRIKEYYSRWDILINLIVAPLTAITVKTMELNTCKKSKECLVDDPAKFVEYFFADEKKSVKFTLKNGKVLSARTVKIVQRNNEIYFAIYENEDDSASKQEIKRDDVKTLEFREGLK